MFERPWVAVRGTFCGRGKVRRRPSHGLRRTTSSRKGTQGLQSNGQKEPLRQHKDQQQAVEAPGRVIWVLRNAQPGRRSLPSPSRSSILIRCFDRNRGPGGSKPWIVCRPGRVAAKSPRNGVSLPERRVYRGPDVPMVSFGFLRPPPFAR